MDKQWVALFRGINVGGHNKLPMKELSSILADLGLQDPRTVIQSGNAVFGHRGRTPSTLARSIEDAVEGARGFRPAVLVFDEPGFRARLEANPFPEATGDPKTLHLFFGESPPGDAALEKIEERRSGQERWHLEGDVFYLHAPDGIGRSKLAASVERLLGVPTTARNWNTLQRVVALLEA